MFNYKKYVPITGFTAIIDWNEMYYICLFSYGLLGSSGCGKTTILGCIVGRKKYEQGQITLFGEKNVGVPGNIVGYMPQVGKVKLRLKV